MMLTARAPLRRVLLLVCAAALSAAGCERRPDPGPVPQPVGRGAGLRPKGAVYADLRRHSLPGAGRDTDPDLSPDGKTLVFSSSRQSEHYNIFLKAPEAQAVVHAWPSESNQLWPRWSPDGKRIVFAADDRGNMDLYLLTPFSGAPPVRVTNDNSDEIHPCWSPEGDRIAYSWLSPRDGEWHLRVRDLATGTDADLGTGFHPDWNPTPGSRVIAFQKPRRREDPWHGLWTIDTDGNRLTEILAPGDWGVIAPSWSPDGRAIVFCSVAKSAAARAEDRTGAGDDLWIVGSDGTGLMQLTSDPGAEWCPRWARDGRIYFCAEMAGQEGIWSVEPRYVPPSAVTPER